MKKNPRNIREYPCEVKKILKKMRITLLLVLLFGFYAEASSQKVTLKVKNHEPLHGFTAIKKSNRSPYVI